MRPMALLRFMSATAVGFLLFHFVVVYLGGFLAAVQVPKKYFNLFGPEYLGVAHALLNLGLHTLPTILLVGGGVVAWHWAFPSRGPSTWFPMLIGMLSYLLLWTLVLSPAHIEANGLPRPSLQEALASPFDFPWWGASSAAAPWLGVVLGGWLIKRSNRAVPRGVA